MGSIMSTVKVDAELADLIPQYLSNRWADLGFARRLLADREFFLLSGMAHRIKGNAASFGFDELGEIAQIVEQAAESNDPMAIDSALEAYDAFMRNLQIEYV